MKKKYLKKSAKAKIEKEKCGTKTKEYWVKSGTTIVVHGVEFTVFGNTKIAVSSESKKPLVNKTPPKTFLRSPLSCL